MPCNTVSVLIVKIRNVISNNNNLEYMSTIKFRSRRNFFRIVAHCDLFARKKKHSQSWCLEREAKLQFTFQYQLLSAHSMCFARWPWNSQCNFILWSYRQSIKVIILHYYLLLCCFTFLYSMSTRYKKTTDKREKMTLHLAIILCSNSDTQEHNTQLDNM